MTSKEFLKELSAFQHEVYPEDYDLCFKFVYNADEIIGLDELVLYWRDHNGRNSRNDVKYADQTFYHIKLDYFLKNEFKPSDRLIVYGAGTKGKKLAKILIENGVSFTWHDGNPKRWGKHIYGKVIGNIINHHFQRNDKYLIALSNEVDSMVLLDQLKSSLVQTNRVYQFC